MDRKKRQRRVSQRKNTTVFVHGVFFSFSDPPVSFSPCAVLLSWLCRCACKIPSQSKPLVPSSSSSWAAALCSALLCSVWCCWICICCCLVSIALLLRCFVLAFGCGSPLLVDLLLQLLLLLLQLLVLLRSQVLIVDDDTADPSTAAIEACKGSPCCHSDSVAR